LPRLYVLWRTREGRLLVEHSLSSVQPRVFFNFFKKHSVWGVYHKGGYKFVPFLIPGTNSSNLYLGSEGGYITVSSWSVVMSLFLVRSLQSTSVQLTSWKKGPSSPLIPFLPQFSCNIPRTQSEADEHKKHDKQKRDEKGQGIHKIPFQAPKRIS
jgi:hypothetical protein